MFRLIDRPPDDLDRLLHGFFRAEMPNPWPEAKVPRAEPSRPLPMRSRPWASGTRLRLCVAASVAALLAGYLFLAQSFPGTSGGAGKGANWVDPGKLIGKDHPDRPKATQRAPVTVPAPQERTRPTRAGGEARLWEQPIGRRMLFKVEETRPPSGDR